MAGSDPWDDDDVELELEDTSSGLDAFHEYAPVAEDEDGWGDSDSPARGDAAVEAPIALFTVTNPPGTVSATTLIGGRIQHIDIHDASDFSEAQLADEIVTLAELAKEKAQAAQHAVTVELMGGLGHDQAGISGYLQQAIELPSPDVSSANMSELFAARYRLRAE